jgi:hypothetical protein
LIKTPAATYPSNLLHRSGKRRRRRRRTRRKGLLVFERVSHLSSNRSLSLRKGTSK